MMFIPTAILLIACSSASLEKYPPLLRLEVPLLKDTPATREDYNLVEQTWLQPGIVYIPKVLPSFEAFLKSRQKDLFKEAGQSPNEYLFVLHKEAEGCAHIIKTSDQKKSGTDTDSSSEDGKRYARLRRGTRHRHRHAHGHSRKPPLRELNWSLEDLKVAVEKMTKHLDEELTLIRDDFFKEVFTANTAPSQRIITRFMWRTKLIVDKVVGKHKISEGLYGFLTTQISAFLFPAVSIYHQINPDLVIDRPMLESKNIFPLLTVSTNIANGKYYLHRYVERLSKHREDIDRILNEEERIKNPYGLGEFFMVSVHEYQYLLEKYPIVKAIFKTFEPISDMELIEIEKDLIARSVDPTVVPKDPIRVKVFKRRGDAGYFLIEVINVQLKSLPDNLSYPSAIQLKMDILNAADDKSFDSSDFAAKLLRPNDNSMQKSGLIPVSPGYDSKSMKLRVFEWAVPAAKMFDLIVNTVVLISRLYEGDYRAIVVFAAYLFNVYSGQRQETKSMLQYLESAGSKKSRQSDQSYRIPDHLFKKVLDPRAKDVARLVHIAYVELEKTAKHQVVSNLPKQNLDDDSDFLD